MKLISTDLIIRKALELRYVVVGLAFLVLLAGIMAFQRLSMEAYPDFTNPLVRVITMYPGKGAEEVERLITIPLEKELNGIPGETKLRSVSLFGLSVVYVTFQDGTSSQVNRQQVLERLAMADLPDDAKPELDPDASPIGEIYRYTLQSDYYNPMTLKALQDWQLEKAFRQIPGVIDVTSFGGPQKNYKVNIDLGRLKAYKLTVIQVFDAIRNANATTGGNYIENNGQAYIIRGLGLLKNQADLTDVVISANEQGTPIRVGDVARISIGPGHRIGQVGKNHDDDVIEGIVLMRRGEDVSKVTNALYEHLPAIQAALPEGVRLVPLYDRLELVRNTMETISHNVAEGIVLVVVVLLLFMFNIRSALIAATVIPLSLLAAFLMLEFCHIPANLLSLGAVDFGIIVDGTVIMVEHIHHRLAGQKHSLSTKERLQLVIRSAQEVGKPILFSTLIIVLAFLPIFSFDGVAGKLFRPLAFTMNFALLGALVMTLTVIPVLCWFFLAQKPIQDSKSPVLSIARKVYRPLLMKAFRYPFHLIGGISLTLLLSLFLFTRIGSEFLPALDEGNIWLRVTVLPTSVSLEQSVQIAHQIREKMTHYPEVKNVVSQIGSPDDGTDPNNPSNIEFLVDLLPAKKWRPVWHEDKQKLVEAMDRDLDEIPGILTTFSQYIQDNVDEAIAGAKGPIVAKVYGPDLDILQGLGDRIAALMNQVPGTVDISGDKILGQPQYQIAVDRNKANRYGVNVDDVAKVIETAIGGKRATQILEGEQRFNVIVRLDTPYRSSSAALRNVLVGTPSGALIPLSEVANLTAASGATVIPRSDNSRVITVKAAARGRDLGGVVTDAQQLIAEKLKLPSGYRLVWGGQYENQREANARLAVAIPITLVLIFLFLFILFRNAVEALVAMAPIPLTLIGGIAALAATGTYFSASAGVGFIAAMGVSVQNGVVMLSYMKHLQNRRIDVYSAAFKGGLAKLSPVLMAGSLAILGLIPAAISNGIGSQSQKPFAIVIIGGLFSSTLLTIFVIPVLYALIQRGVRKQNNIHPLEIQQERASDHETAISQTVFD